MLIKWIGLFLQSLVFIFDTYILASEMVSGDLPEWNPNLLLSWHSIPGAGSVCRKHAIKQVVSTREPAGPVRRPVLTQEHYILSQCQPA